MLLVTGVASYKEEAVSMCLVEQAFLSRMVLEFYADTLSS